MKKLFLSLLIMTVILLGAQSKSKKKKTKFKVKKNIVYVNKKPVYKIEGVSGLFKDADLTIKTLDDKPVIHIKEKSYKSEITKDIHYYDLKFLTLNKSTSLFDLYHYSKKRSILKNLFKMHNATFLKSLDVTESKISEFISNNEGAEKIRKDTTADQNFKKLRRKTLLSIRDRNKKAEVKLEKMEDDKSTLEIYQDDILLGFISYKTVNDENEKKYTIYIKLENSFIYNEKGHYYAEVANYDESELGSDFIYVNDIGKKIKFTIYSMDGDVRKQMIWKLINENHF